MSNSNKIGLLSSTALVVGNMIGSGIFLLPASLALYGGIGMIGWVFAALGALLIAYVYGALGKIAPNTIGGPYIYTRISFGNFSAFLVAWGYWVAIWATNAAIAVALVGYLEVFFPILGSSPLISILTGLLFIWLFTYINSKPLKTIASIQIITTILKVLPILAIGFFGVFFINWDNFIPFNRSELSSFGAITTTTTLTLFAFLGMESAGIISGETKNASKTVNKATLIGTVITILVYLSSSLAIMGVIPPETLQSSTAPFADAANIFWGDSAKFIIAGCAIIATIGALNGWILLQGRIPMAAALDGLFPKVFKKQNDNKSPVIGIVISSILASLLMMFNFSKSLVEAFTFMMTLSTLSCVIPYLFSAASLALILFNKHKRLNHPSIRVSFLAFCFCIWIIIGCGYEIVFYGTILLLVGIPFYLYLKKKNNE
ncbi:amino acid permease [Croceitalea vernalis]|uniref:Arginine/agmatine antiporter n=1 Tax=Croceitalea vernalis TaxID=3075599 RepID=A0ABU3BGJ7_9FLAO|nr:amino acid permease [Croceitalea sp. P007]MDT0621287.1 amino acid permease [Croceitalea sp. P007]